MAKVVSFSNQKGGVGKTTSAVNIAASLGVLGYNTLLVDLDPQGNATSGLGIPKSKLKKTVYDGINSPRQYDDGEHYVVNCVFHFSPR